MSTTEPGTFAKRPYDQFAIPFDYANKLPSGLTVTSATLSAVDMSDGSDATSAVLVSTVGTVLTGNLQVLATVKAGIAGKDYLIACRAALSDGTSKTEDTVVMKVLNI